MSSKDEILKLLQEEPAYISGEKMAERLHISRNAVWKAVQSLKKQGYEIQAVTNRGYILTGRNSIVLKKEEICRYLDPETDPDLLHVYESVKSTNIMAKEMAVSGAGHGTTIVAGRQTGGQAHREKSFYSPPGGIYLSIVLNPACFQRTDPEYFSETSAVAVMQAISEVCGIQTVIRGRNDLYYNGRKVCGILNEMVMDLEDSDIQWIVTGIGIHFAEKTSDFPEKVREVTTSLYPDGRPSISINRLAAEVMNEFLTEKYGSRGNVGKLYHDHHADR